MPTDLELIKQLEKEIGTTLEEAAMLTYARSGTVYQVDSNGNVVRLALESRELKALPRTVLKFKKLEYLSLYDNKLSKLPHEITQLTNLTILVLHANRLGTLPSEIKLLTNLTYLDLSDNQLSTLPPEISQLKNLTDLDLSNNPLKQPPPEIVEQGIPAIFEYLNQLTAKKEELLVNEAKLILVGQGDVGKTCLAKRLIYGTFQEEKSTEGIDILPWSIRAPNKRQEEIKLNVWDFGGQEIYHSTHQFFLTKRSLYLLVWNARKSKDYSHIDYWLHTIEAFGEDSPVILVLSKCKEREDDLNMKDLREKFPNIVDLLKVDSSDGTGIDRLKKVIAKQSWALPHMQTAWVTSWLDVRKQLEADERNWIEYKEFVAICKSKGLDKDQTDILDTYLHDLGVVIHFRDRVELRNMVVLKPDWATSAVYKVLDTDSVRKSGGRLRHSDLEKIWDTGIYPTNVHPELLKLMERFELAYELPGKQEHLVAELLPSTEPDFDWDDNDNLRFYYRYDFLPPGVMPRFIVGVNEDLETVADGKQLQWREGAVLQREGARAFVKASRLEKLVEIKICGSANKKRELLAIVRSRIDHINASMKNVQITQEIPCNCSKTCANTYDYDKLLVGELKGVTHVTCDETWQEVSLSKLLDGYERRADRMKEGQMKDERGDKIHIDFRPTVIAEGGKADVKVQASADAHADVDIAIDIKVDLPAIQDDFAGLKEALANVDPRLEKELDRIEDSLDDVTPESGKEKLAKPMNKMRRFLEKVGDEDSDFHAAVKGAKKGVEMAQKVGKTYNKFAQWLALPQVPELFLGGG